MVFSEVPDCLSIITYLSHYYHFFNKSNASPSSFRPSHATGLTNCTRTKALEGPKPRKILPALWSSREVHLSSGRPQSFCTVCRKHVHLAQRHLIEGKLYHRSCFRCKVCDSTLLPGSYKQGGDASSLICTYHITETENTSQDSSCTTRPTEQQHQLKSATGFADNIANHLCYAGKIESQDRLVCMREEAQGGDSDTRQGERKQAEDKEEGHSSLVSKVKRLAPTHPPQHGFKDGTLEGSGKAGKLTILANTELHEKSTQNQEPARLAPTLVDRTVSAGSSRPIPAPRRMLNSSAPPVPAPRTKTLYRMDSSSTTAGSRDRGKSPPSPSFTTSPAGASCKVKTNHPWMAIVHPGPWTQLPSAPDPMSPPRSSSAPVLRKGWFRPREPPPNPFDELADENTENDTKEDSKAEDSIQTPPPQTTSQAENGADMSNKSADICTLVRSDSAANTATKPEPERKATPADKPILARKPVLKYAPPTAMDSAQKDVSSVSSDLSGTDTGLGGTYLSVYTPDLSKTGDLDGLIGAVGGMAPNLSKTSEPGVLDFTDITGGLKIPDAGEDSNMGGFSVPDLPSASVGVSLEDLAEKIGPCELGKPASGSDLLDLAETGGVGGLAGAASKVGVVSLTEIVSSIGELGPEGANSLSSSAAASDLGLSDLAGVRGLGRLSDTKSEPQVPEFLGNAASLDLMALKEAGATAGLDEADVTQSLPFPKSLSMPAISSVGSKSSSKPTDLPELNESEQKHEVCDRKTTIPKSKTFQDRPSRRAPAPGYGFPLIKRKVQTDAYIPKQDLQVEKEELDKQLETLERRGVELERNLRGGKNDKEAEEMLMEWFSLIQEKHVLVRRDAEIVCLTKQKSLEERQADVEYELRCLLNKPETGWNQKDRGREQHLMDELVTIIEQRNQIISILDQDRQREREEDMVFEAVMKNKVLQKEGLKELRKSKGRFKPMKVLKMLNHKVELTKDSKYKKS
ncbi:MICAL-like protein 1 isoform X1 [Lampris incognitus]|nr:MICAL-like protein 1 isoform X1 [Lampris incognitus]